MRILHIPTGSFVYYSTQSPYSNLAYFLDADVPKDVKVRPSIYLTKLIEAPDLPYNCRDSIAHWFSVHGYVTTVEELEFV